VASSAETALAICVALIFIAWFLLSCYTQLPGRQFRVCQSSHFMRHTLPRWHFFSPKTVQLDFEVWYRSAPELDETCDVAEWVHLDGISARHPAQALIYPGRRTKHVLFECCHQILKAAAEIKDSSDAIMFSIPYLLLLQHVTAQCDADDAVQFRIDTVSAIVAAASRTSVFRSLIHRPSPALGLEQAS
jgi:hypothetical protein